MVLFLLGGGIGAFLYGTASDQNMMIAFERCAILHVRHVVRTLCIHLNSSPRTLAPPEQDLQVHLVGRVGAF